MKRVIVIMATVEADDEQVLREIAKKAGHQLNDLLDLYGSRRITLLDSWNASSVYLYDDELHRVLRDYDKAYGVNDGIDY